MTELVFDGGIWASRPSEFWVPLSTSGIDISSNSIEGSIMVSILFSISAITDYF